MNVTVEIGGKEYSLPRINTFELFELTGRLTGMLALLSLQEDRAMVAAKFPQAFAALSNSMTREDRDFVLQTCLRGVTRRGGKGEPFTPIMSRGGDFMFEDIDMQTMLHIVWEVLERHRVIDFFSDSRSESGQPSGQASSGSGTRTLG